MERDFVAAGPNTLWVADITYISTWTGSLYLSVVVDACPDRRPGEPPRVVGWAMATHLRTELVLDALEMAIRRRHPAGAIHQSDQNSQHVLDRQARIHLDRLRQVLPGNGCPAFDGIGRRLLRQCAV